MSDENKDKFDLDKEIETPKIENAEDVQSWVDNSGKLLNGFREVLKEKDETIETMKTEKDDMKKEIKDLGDLVVINKNSWQGTDRERAADYAFGQFLGAVRNRDVKKLHALGTKVVVSNRAWEDVKILPMNEAGKYLKFANNDIGEKGDLGTPLTGDATGTDAQYLVPQTIYEETILRTLMVKSEVIPRFTKVTMRGRLHRFPTEGTAFALTHVTNEVTDKTEQTPTWSYKDLTAETWAGYVGITDELIEDTFADIGGQLRIQAVEAYQKAVETGLLTGSTSAVTGIIEDSSCVSEVSGTTTFAGLDWDDLANTKAELTTKGKRTGGAFVMHPTMYDVFEKVTDSGGYIFDVTKSAPRAAWGYPVYLSDYMPDIDDSTVSAAVLFFGNLKYMLYGVRMGLEIKYFDQTMYAVQDDENFFRIRTRFAGTVGIPANFAVLKTAAS